MAAILVSQSCTAGNPRAGIRIPGRFALTLRTNHEPYETDDRRNSSRDVCTLNKSFFFAPNQRYHSRMGILKNPALKARKGTKAWKVVKLTKGGFCFHKSNITTINQNKTSFERAFT
jgi:hypothetical protein